MKLNFKHHEGSQVEKPTKVDIASSPTVVYVRNNIEQITREEASGETVTLWSYDEAELTKEEYVQYQTELNAANIDYLSAMTGFDV